MANQIVKVFGQELPAAFQERDRKKMAPGTKTRRHKSGLIYLLKAGCASLSRPTGFT